MAVSALSIQNSANNSKAANQKYLIDNNNLMSVNFITRPNGQKVSQLQTIDLTKRVAVPVANGELAFTTFSIAVDQATQRVYYIETGANGRIAYWDPKTGKNTILTDASGKAIRTGANEIVKLDQAKNGVFYSLDWQTNKLYTLDAKTGTFKERGDIKGLQSGSGDVAVDPQNPNRLFVLSAGPDSHKLYSVDLKTNTATLLGDTGFKAGAAPTAGALEFANGKLYATFNRNGRGELYQLTVEASGVKPTFVKAFNFIPNDFTSALKQDTRGNNPATPGEKPGCQEGDKFYGSKKNDKWNGTNGWDLARGYAGNDTIRGGKCKDTLHGGLGHDDLVGDRGADLIRAGRNGDKVHGNSGSDTLDGGRGGDLIKGGIGPDRLLGKRGDDVIYGQDGDDLLRGRLGNDMLRGGKGDDTIVGNADNDTLVGGLGDDTLTGNSGKDVFVFKSFKEGLDQITDFDVKNDRIDLRDILNDKQYLGVSNPLSRFVRTETAGSNTQLLIDTNGTKAGGFQELAILQGFTGGLNKNNFIV